MAALTIFKMPRSLVCPAFCPSICHTPANLVRSKCVGFFDREGRGGEVELRRRRKHHIRKIKRKWISWEPSRQEEGFRGMALMRLITQCPDGLRCGLIYILWLTDHEQITSKNKPTITVDVHSHTVKCITECSASNLAHPLAKWTVPSSFAKKSVMKMRVCPWS